MAKFVQIKKSERAPLRIGRTGNPDRELLRLQLLQLRRRFRRHLRFFHLDLFRLEAMLARGKATPARFSEKPKPVVRRFAFSRMRRSFANRILKSSLSFLLVAGHQETKAIQLRQIFSWSSHAEFRKSRKLTCLSSRDKGRLRTFYCNFCIRRATSCAFSRLLKAEMRM